jgi:hypothetical protein
LASAGGKAGDIWLWDPATGEAVRRLVGNGVSAWAVGWSPDGERVAWGTTLKFQDLNNMGPLERTFDLPGGMPAADVGAGERWVRAVTRQEDRSLTIADDKMSVILRQGEREVARCRPSDETYDTVCCFGFSPGGEVVIGSAFTLSLLDAAGRRQRVFVGHTGVVWALAVSPDGRYLASAGGDQTVRIWPLRDAPHPPTLRTWLSEKWRTWLAGTPAVAGLLDDPDGLAKLKEYLQADEKLKQFAPQMDWQPASQPLLSLFRGGDGEWVAWTPEGYYACSPGAEKMIGWQINRGIEHTADYFPAYQFRRRLYRPDVIARLLEAGSTAEAVKLADADRPGGGGGGTVQPVADLLPPSITILSPEPGAVVDAAQVTVRAKVVDPKGRAITGVKLLVNGRQARDIEIIGGGGPNDWSGTATLAAGQNTVTVIATNNVGSDSVPATVTVTYRAPEEVHKPNLYLLAVGVSEYQNPAFNLRFAAKDATDLAAVWQQQQGRLFEHVTAKVLTNAGASRDAVLDGLDWLAKQVTQHDYAVVFVSGHGQADPRGTYYFLPHGVDPDALKRTAVVWSEFQTTLASLPCKTLLLLDTCHAGGATGSKTKGANVYLNVIRDAMAEESGVITMASCMGQEVSLEDEEWGNGAFSKALIAGLGGAAADKDGTVTLAALDAYVTEEVKRLTGGRQHPTTGKPSTVRGSLPLAVAK